MPNGVGISNEDACVMPSGGGVREPFAILHAHALGTNNDGRGDLVIT